MKLTIIIACLMSFNCFAQALGESGGNCPDVNESSRGVAKKKCDDGTVVAVTASCADGSAGVELPVER